MFRKDVSSFPGFDCLWSLRKLMMTLTPTIGIQRSWGLGCSQDSWQLSFFSFDYRHVCLDYAIIMRAIDNTRPNIGNDDDWGWDGRGIIVSFPYPTDLRLVIVLDQTSFRVWAHRAAGRLDGRLCGVFPRVRIRLSCPRFFFVLFLYGVICGFLVGLFFVFIFSLFWLVWGAIVIIFVDFVYVEPGYCLRFGCFSFFLGGDGEFDIFLVDRELVFGDGFAWEFDVIGVGSGWVSRILLLMKRNSLGTLLMFIGVCWCLLLVLVYVETVENWDVRLLDV